MSQDLIQRTARKIAVDYCRLSIVRNPDGFLAREEVMRALREECGLQVVADTNLQLRIHYELVYKASSEEERFVYLCNDTESLVPDMTADAHMTEFDVADLFPLFADKSALGGLDLETLEIIDQKVGLRRLDYMACTRLVDEARHETEQRQQQSADSLLASLNNLSIDWSGNATQGMMALSRLMIDAIRFGIYKQVDEGIRALNRDFQRWVDESYFAMLNSNTLLRPKSVNNILPHLGENYGNDDSLALIVVDGLSFWQYAVLSDYLHHEGIPTTDATTLAWIPTITMLSRQAIFRGSSPLQDYKQNPVNERRLWQDYWQQRGVPGFAIQYLSDSDEFAVNEGVRRLAYVTVEMDEKMHSSTDYRDLLSLTENWCPRIAEKIETLRRMGYRIFLTTDHGSVLSHGWQPISSVEKVFLYKDGSRGKRHLIYNELAHKEDFLRHHSGEVDLLSRDNWLAARTDFCFAREGQQIITHGGCHLWEVVIPFVTIG